MPRKGEITFFDKNKNGLHVAPSLEISKGSCLLSASEENHKELCSKKQVSGAKKTRIFVKLLHVPSLEIIKM